MDDIKNIVKDIIKTISHNQPEVQKKIQTKWQELLGDDNKFTKIIELKEGKLIIHVDSPARLYQINLKKKKYLTEIKKDIPEVTAIFTKVGKI